MRRLVNGLFVLILLGGMLGVGSYLGARATAGKVVGSNPPLSDRTVTFALRGAEELRNRPRAWVIRFNRSQLPGVRTATIFVSPTGKLIATRPADLDQRLEAWEAARQP